MKSFMCGLGQVRTERTNLEPETLGFGYDGLSSNSDVDHQTSDSMFHSVYRNLNISFALTRFVEKEQGIWTITCLLL